MEITMEKETKPESSLLANEALLDKPQSAFLWFLRNKSTNSSEGLKEILPTFRSKTILIICFPNDFTLKELAQTLHSYYEELLGFRIIQRKNAPSITSMVIYFKTQTVAESFYIVDFQSNQPKWSLCVSF